MEITPYQETEKNFLHDFWQELTPQIPFFFPVPIGTWEDCLLRDRIEGDLIFKHLDTLLAVEAGRVLDFIQFGQPTFAWNTHGQRYPDPQIGVIRQLYFDQDRLDVGEVLLATAMGTLSVFDPIHAFYHIMGMSCSAYHGKLHCSQAHVEKLLLSHGFQVEHENYYFVLNLNQFKTNNQQTSRLEINHRSDSGNDGFEVHLGGKMAGSADFRYLADLTVGGTQDTAYLTWFSVDEKFRRQGTGSGFLSQLGELLSGECIRFIHTDTAAGNFQAIRLYKKMGFEQKGVTRSFIRIYCV